MTDATKKQIHRIFHILDIIDKICDSSTDDNDDDAAETYPYVATKRIRRPSYLKFANPAVVPTSLKDVQNPLNHYADDEFQQRYRFDKETVHDILQMIEYGLTKLTNRGQPISPMLELLITLRFLATGSFQQKDGRRRNETAVSQPTVSRILKKVTTLLSELKLRFIKIPDRMDAAATKRLANQFQQIGSFPEVFACVGATHVAVRSPGKTVSDGYLNEFGFYSFRACMLCGPDLQFFEMISRWPGGTHENKIFNISEMHQRFEYQPMEGIVLLADKNYAARNFVMVPVEQPHNAKEWKYNEAHRKTYVIPAAVALWKRRFGCLQTVLNNKEGSGNMEKRV